MDVLESRVKKESLEELLNTCGQLTHDCFAVANALNTAPVTLVALAKEGQCIANALRRLHELSRTFAADPQDVCAANNKFIYAVAKDVHELKAALKRIKGPDRDSGIALADPSLIIVWNEPGLRDLSNRLRVHQASLQSLLNATTRPADGFEDGSVMRHRTIEPDPEVDEELRKLGRRFTGPDRQTVVLPRVSDCVKVQVLLDTLVPPSGVVYRRSREMAQQLHFAIDHSDEEAVFRLLLDRVDPNISLPGSMLAPLHRAFDQQNLLIAAFLAVAGADVDEPTNDGYTALMRGIICGFAGQFAALLLHLGARINAIDNEGCSAVHHSTILNSVDDETFDIITETGADLNLLDYKGRTPLHIAIQSGHLTAAMKLIKAGADLETRLPDGKTALHLAISARNQELTQILISRGANVDRVLREHTPLTMSISSWCTAITAILIDGGADPNLASRNGNTPLLTAAATGHEETIRYLLANGVDVSACKSRSGYTAMHMAAHKNRAHVFRLLVESGAPIDALDQAGETPLVIASKLGNSESALQLVKHGADVERAGPDGVSVLSHAVKSGDMRLIEKLLEEGAGLEMARYPMRGSSYVIPEPHTTPIHVAAQHGLDGILVKLVKGGARLESTIYPGRTPLFAAASHGHVSTVRLLLQLGANAQARTTHGDTVLFVASGNLATLGLLLQQGIPVNHVNDHGATALHYAALRGHVEGAKLLVKKGAKQFQANAVWDNWDDRVEGGQYRQGTPAGIARQRGFNKLAAAIDRSKC